MFGSGFGGAQRCGTFRVLGNDGARAGDLAGELNSDPMRHVTYRFGAFRRPTLSGGRPCGMVATSAQLLMAADTPALPQERASLVSRRSLAGGTANHIDPGADCAHLDTRLTQGFRKAWFRLATMMFTNESIRRVGPERFQGARLGAPLAAEFPIGIHRRCGVRLDDDHWSGVKRTRSGRSQFRVEPDKPGATHRGNRAPTNGGLHR
jgi:hypothetical protein